MSFLSISPSRKLNDMRRRSLADTESGECRLRRDVEGVACVKEAFTGRRGEGFEAGEGFFDRGVEADGVDC